jgi:transposase
MKKLTAPYYGSCGQKSIDPSAFMKMMLIGYLENIQSDRHLVNHCSMRLDILFFLGHDLDEALPWHSTLSRTRDLHPQDVITQAFEHVLDMCIGKGMALGRHQAIDSAPIKASASMDSLETKVPQEDLQAHLRRVRAMSSKDRSEKSDENGPKRKAKNNQAASQQQTITADKRELKELSSRNKNWSAKQTGRPGANDPRSKYTSNKTHYSPVDPDARISVKPGKARKLNYSAQMAVDTSHHVITHIEADFADKKDNQSLQNMTLTLKRSVSQKGL